MRRVLLSILFSLICCSSVLSQEEDLPTSQIETLVEPNCPAQKRLIFVVDTSGSMDRVKVGAAIQTVINICNAPIDDFQVSAISFGGDTRRWEGTEDIDPRTGKDISPPGWSAFPSAKNLEILDNWLWKSIDKGSTDVNSAFEEAFNIADGIEEVSIVLISDCDFDASSEYLAKVIQKRQEVRFNKHMPVVTIGIFGITSSEPVKTAIKTNLSNYCALGIFNLYFP